MTARPTQPRHLRAVAAATVLVLAAVAAACGSSATSSSTSATGGPTSRTGGTVRLLTDTAFAVSKPVLRAFEQRTGIHVDVVTAGDGVEVVNKAVLTKSDPEGDVLYGIDNNTLTVAFDNGIFVPYRSPGLALVDPQYQLDPEHRVTPIDKADVCVDYDVTWFRSHHLAPPRSLGDLVDPRYKGLFVTEDPTSSTPGLAFLLATIAARGSNGWQAYWKALRTNGVQVANDWTAAFYDSFSGGGGKGTKPIVVSYATDPAYAVINAKPQPSSSPIGVVDDTCYRQIEFAGVLAGARHPAAARALVDFLLSTPFQEDMPLEMYVQPVNRDARLPALFSSYVARPARVLSMPAALVGQHRQTWVEQWTNLVAR
ncbi:MAG TPA: thiamine ABC transporter substrate-binding protein [Acidimicrobiales bacterium]|nr:thiamine ABC transporter substrate-binding protein [Acidimicrobiales bacterium]